MGFLAALCSMSVAFAKTDYRSSLELNRKAHELYIQGEFKKSHEILLQSYSLYPQDTVLNESRAALASKIYMVAADRVFQNEDFGNVTLGLERFFSPEGKITFSFRLIGRVHKEKKVLEARVSLPSGEIVDILGGEDRSYPSKDQNFFFLWVASKKMENGLAAGVYTLSLRLQGESKKDIRYSFFLLPDPRPSTFPKFNISAESADWIVPHSKAYIAGMGQTAVLYQYGENSKVAIASMPLTSIEFGKAKFLLQTQAHKCILMHWEGLSKNPFGIYYLHQTEKECSK